jgi:hypothetical protein
MAAFLYSLLFPHKAPLSAALLPSMPSVKAWDFGGGRLPNPDIGGSNLEMSRGFASFFTSDVYLQNILSYVISPIFFILLIAFIAWIIYRLVRRYDQKIKDEIMKGQQLLLFKAKKMGLTEYQFKILKGITDILHIEKPSLIMDDPHLFESSIRSFLRYAAGMGEQGDALQSICRDLVITYEKIYHHTDIRRPLTALKDLEVNSLMVIRTEENTRFVGKLRVTGKDTFRIHPFISEKELHALRHGIGVTVTFWRAGDAEYEFNSVLVGVKDGMIDLISTGEFVRGQSVPHPLIDIVIPCTLTPHSAAAQSAESIAADIFKLNESEAIIRCKDKLLHDHPYVMTFSVADFTVRTDVNILSERYIADRHIFYFNLRFAEISDAAKTVISSYITERLFE